MSVAEKLFIEEEKIKLIKELGEGSYGKVWAGECLRKPVAVKVIGDTKLSELSEKKFKELEQEVSLMTESLHENIILAMGMSTHEEKLAIVMELMDGDLDTLLIKNKKAKLMSLYQRLAMARDAALGMNWLHSREPAIIHRDLKLENLMYKINSENNYTIKIADFGLAVVKPKKKKALRGEALGTPVTMAPEIMQEKPFTQKADVYSFGLCLWQIVTLERLFPNAKPEKFIKAICVKGERPPIPESLRQSDPDLVDLIECCWDTDPQARPSFHEILLKLDEILINVAISDASGRRFWTSNFDASSKNRNIPWDHFWEALSRYLGIDQEDGVARLCVRALLTDCHRDKKTEVINIECFGHFLRWYGPLDPEGEGDRSDEDKSYSIPGDRRTSRSMVRRLEELIRAAWFHGQLDNEEAARKLQGKEVNTFLVRCSSAPGLFAVTRVINSKGQTQASRLAQSNKGFMVEGSSDNVQYFESLNSLIETLVARLNWKHCPGSPFSSLLEEKGEADGLDPYSPLLH